MTHPTDTQMTIQQFYDMLSSRDPVLVEALAKCAIREAALVRCDLWLDDPTRLPSMVQTKQWAQIHTREMITELHNTLIGQISALDARACHRLVPTVTFE